MEVAGGGECQWTDYFHSCYYREYQLINLSNYIAIASLTDNWEIQQPDLTPENTAFFATDLYPSVLRFNTWFKMVINVEQS